MSFSQNHLRERVGTATQLREPPLTHPLTQVVLTKTHHFPRTFPPERMTHPAVRPDDKLLDPFPRASRQRLFAFGSQGCRSPVSSLQSPLYFGVSPPKQFSTTRVPAGCKYLRLRSIFLSLRGA